MELDEYLWRNRISKKHFAEMINIRPHSLSSIVFKKVTPNLTTAINIVSQSGGMVTFRELVKDGDQKNVV